MTDYWCPECGEEFCDPHQPNIHKRCPYCGGRPKILHTDFGGESPEGG